MFFSRVLGGVFEAQRAVQGHMVKISDQEILDVHAHEKICHNMVLCPLIHKIMYFTVNLFCMYLTFYRVIDSNFIMNTTFGIQINCQKMHIKLNPR